MYQERPSRIPGAVVWSRSADERRGRTTRVLPDGCMDLIWLGDAGLVVAGPDTQAHMVPGPTGAYTGLRFAPGWGPAVFGIPASELRDRREPLAVVDGARDARALAERIAEAPDRALVLEDFAARRLRGGSPDPVAAAAARRLRGGVGVAELARDLGLSDRQLHRRSVAAFGYGPKVLARVLRLRRALDLAYAGNPFAEVAAVAGYADQAHMSREVRALAGLSLSELVGF